MGVSNITVEGAVLYANNFKIGSHMVAVDGREYTVKIDPYWPDNQVWVSEEVPEERQCLRCDRRCVWTWVYDPAYAATGLPAADPFVVKLCVDHGPKHTTRYVDVFFQQPGTDCSGCSPTHCDYPVCQVGGARAALRECGCPINCEHNCGKPNPTVTMGGYDISASVESVSLDRGDPV